MEPLTKLDIAALRKADAICFDHNVWRNADRGERASFIRAIKRGHPTATDPYATDVTHRIEVPVSRLTRSSAEDEWRAGVEFAAFHMEHSAQYNDVYGTLVRFLRPGDYLHLHWTRGNSSGYLTEAGLHRDELRVVVVRGERAHTFLVAVSVCKDNTARMTQVLS